MATVTLGATMFDIQSIINWIDDDPKTPVRTIWGVTLALELVATVVVLTKLITQGIRRKFGLEDILLAFAWMCSVAVAAVTWAGDVTNQTGTPLFLIRPAKQPSSSALIFGGLIVYQLCIWFTKLSVATLYLRLSETKSDRWYSSVTVGVLIAGGFAFTTCFLLQCDPALNESFFNHSTECYCMPIYPITVASTAFNAVAGLWLMFMGVICAFNSRWSNWHKTVLWILFVFGAFAIAAQVIRLFLWLNFIMEIELSWNSGYFLIWTVVECTVGLVCAAIPGLPKSLESAINNPKIEPEEEAHIENSRHISVTKLGQANEIYSGKTNTGQYTDGVSSEKQRRKSKKVLRDSEMSARTHMSDMSGITYVTDLTIESEPNPAYVRNVI